MFDRILVVLDNLENEQQQTFATALAIAKVFSKQVTHNARLMLLHVLPEEENSYQELYGISNLAYHLKRQSMDQENLDDYHQYKLQSWEILRSLHAQAKDTGITSDFAQLMGETDLVTRVMARRWGADLVVVKGHQPGDRSINSVNPNHPHHDLTLTDDLPCAILIA
ncbi:MAG: universal stress protein [Leptolyngbya sp. Prado105]|jgi:nucleotide-binding universal stress UspA family protein|nr:universal stress protein [Leptolyngbya sp. Prado105]